MNFPKSLLFFLLSLLCGRGLHAQNFRDLSLPLPQRVELLMEALTPDEKIGMLCATQPAVERLGIPAYDWWSECLHGVARNGRATVFPKPIGTGSAWDPKLVGRIAAAVSDEARAKYHAALRERGYTARYEGLTFFSPTLNLARDPRWGRTEECYSEDPLLMAELGEAFIRGLQGEDGRYLKVAATAKHFVANNEENRRLDGSSDVDVRSLREYYLPAFHRAVAGGGAASVMGAYNALNGVPCCANSFLLDTLLRREWGFGGPTISDGSAIAKLYTHHRYVPSPEAGAALALRSGCDMSLRDEYREALPRALEQGLIGQADVDSALRRVLTLRFRLGMFDPPEQVPYANIPDTVVECAAHRALALEAARKSIILLKNEGILPLERENLRRIALIGEAFRQVHYGDYSAEPLHNLTLLEALQNQGPNGSELRWATDVTGPELIPAECYVRPQEHAYDGLVGLTGEYFANNGLQGDPFLIRHDNLVDFRPADRRNSGMQARAAETGLSVRWRTSLSAPRTTQYRIVLEQCNAASFLSVGGQIASPDEKGNLTLTLHLNQGQRYELLLESRGIASEGNVRLLWEEIFPQGTPDAAALAAASDAAVIFLRDAGGAEGSDRRTLSPDPKQLDLVRRVVAANPRTVVILGTSAPLVLTDLAETAPALLCCWIAGQGESQALADILFGAVNPSGRTPVTFFADERELPPLDDYNVAHGRTYQYFRSRVLYPFGYGLSYTTYEYGKPRLRQSRLHTNGTLRFSVEVSNCGERDGDEVVQCYVASPMWQSDGLKQKLVAFRRISLRAGEARQVVFEVKMSDLARWDETSGGWSVISGKYELRVGPDSERFQALSFEVN